MICENVLGNISEERFHGFHIDFVDIEWYEALRSFIKRLPLAARRSVSGWEMIFWSEDFDRGMCSGAEKMR